MPKKKPAFKPNPAAKPVAAPSSADTHRAKMAEVSRDKSAKAREVGPPDHTRRNVERWEACRGNFRLFCETYLAEWFFLGWGPDHLRAIGKIEAAVLKGERFAFAMPRGSGKTTLCEAAAMWSLLYGHRRFVLLIGAESEAATELLAEVMEELEVNDLLHDDFNEVAKYIRALEGIAQRANGQTCDGERTRIEWTEKMVRFPTVPGSVSSASIIKVAGITGRIRGMKVKGRRPDLVILDDPQTDESSASLTQVRTREKVMVKAVLGLAGPKVQIAALCPCTVIFPNDMADRVLDPARHPRWQGERMKMVYHFPANGARWAEYADILGDVGGEKAATAHYVRHRAEMDAGAVVAWLDRYPEGKVSAIQHAMDLLIDDRAAFMAEAQNEPEADVLDGEVCELVADVLAARVTGLPRGVVPQGCSRVTAGIDVQGGCHYAVVVAWDDTFGGSVIDYVAWPKQIRPWFQQVDARPSLATEFPGLAEEARIYAGLKAMCEAVLSRSYRQDGTGVDMRVELCLIDSGNWTDTVYQFCRQTPFRDLVRPSKGRGIKAGDKPMSEWRKAPGDTVGWNWRVDAQALARHVLIDVNGWKSFVATRLTTEPPTGCLLLPGDDPKGHDLFASHLTAEYQTETSGRGRVLREWKWRPERNDNHWWDALILSAVAASVRGLVWDTAGAAGEQGVSTPARVAVKLSEIQRQKREAKRTGRRTTE